MQKGEFAYRIRSLLPGASGTAMEQFVSYAEELERDGTERSDTFYDCFYVELSLVKRDHGETVAEKLFNFGEHPFLPIDGHLRDGLILSAFRLFA